MTDQPIGPAASGPDDADNRIDLRKFLDPESLADIERAMREAAELTESGHASSTIGTVAEPTLDGAAPVVGFIESQRDEDDDEPTGWWQQERRAVLPPAFADPETARRTLLQARAIAWNRTQFHGLRTPVYAARATWVAMYGAWTLRGDAVHYLFAGEYVRPIKDAKKAKNDGLVETLRDARSAKIGERFKSKRAITGLVGGGLYVTAMLVTASIGEWIVAGPMMTAVAGLCGVAGYRARREQAEQAGAAPFTLLDTIPQERQELSDERLTNALRAVGILKKDEEVRPVGLIGREKTGDVTAEIATIDLPAGVTAKKCAAALVEIAGALGIDQVQLDIQQAGPAGRVSFWVADRDPFATSRPSPLLEVRAVLDAWKDGIPVAFTKRGQAIRIKVKDSSYLIGGMTRAGKGIAIMSLVLGALFDTRIKVRFFDGKESGEYNRLAPMLHTFVKGDPKRLAEFLRVMVGEMKRRMHILGKLGKAKLSPDLLELLGGLELFIVDEVASYTDIDAIKLFLLESGDDETKPEDLRDAIIGSFNLLSSKGAAAGMILVLSTQMPEVAVIPSRLRSNVTSKWAMKTESAQHSNNILGGGMSGTANAADIPLEQRGRGILMTPDIGIVENRSFFIDDEAGEVEQLAKVAYAIREAAKVLPGDQADQVEEELYRLTGMSSVAGGIGEDVGIIVAGRAAGVHGILAAMLAAFEQAGNPDRMGRDALVAALVAADPEQWGPLQQDTPSKTGTALKKVIDAQLAADAETEARKPRELSSKEWSAGGKDRGYLLDDVRAAAGIAP
ncbi:FtsK/SpoIIIE domain-containing protein [Kitasatospora sp. NPDC056181]|uniref:FtsK/SpoIIIE domain-containing protein n=1 Tax=Kitasatospora sp. NPDC056181 TaxID=3345737 RepID=UPI0035E0F420